MRERGSKCATFAQNHNIWSSGHTGLCTACTGSSWQNEIKGKLKTSQLLKSFKAPRSSWNYTPPYSPWPFGREPPWVRAIIKRNHLSNKNYPTPQHLSKHEYSCRSGPARLLLWGRVHQVSLRERLGSGGRAGQKGENTICGKLKGKQLQIPIWNSIKLVSQKNITKLLKSSSCLFLTNTIDF